MAAFQSKPLTLREAIEETKDTEDFMGATQVICNYCQRLGHTERDCRAKMNASQPSKPAATNTTNNRPAYNRSNSYGNLNSYNNQNSYNNRTSYGRQNSYGNQNNQKSNEQQGNEKPRAPECYYCKKIGHTSRDCRKKQYDEAQNAKNQPTRNESAPNQNSGNKPKSNTHTIRVGEEEDGPMRHRVQFLRQHSEN